MNLAETMRGLLRRWYILLIGIILAAAVGVGSWVLIAPTYERSAALLLLPGGGTLPATAQNPYLSLGSLTYAADVVVSVMGSDQILADLVRSHPDLQVTVYRDPASAGPVVMMTVKSRTDRTSAEVLDELGNRMINTVDSLQDEAAIEPQNRMTVARLWIDQVGTLQQRARVVISVGSAGAVALLTVFLASIIEGFARRRRHTSSDSAADLEATSVETDAETGAERNEQTASDESANLVVDSLGPNRRGASGK